MKRVAVLLPFALVSCSPLPGVPQCEERALDFRIHTCVSSSDGEGWDGADGGFSEATVSGTVVDSGEGAPPDGCGPDGIGAWRIGAGEEVDPALSRWFLLEGEWRVWTVTYALPSPSEPIPTGTAVELRHRVQSAHSLDEQELEVRMGAELLLYAAEAHSIDVLQPPDELSIAVGDAVCWTPIECGDRSSHDLAVTAGDQTVTVAPGGRGEVGSFEVLHMALEQGAGPGRNCLDYVPGYVRLAVRGQ